MSIKKKILFIVNPISGGKSKARLVKLINERFNKSIVDYSIIETTHKGHAGEIAKANLNSSDIIVAVGGDGTINEVAKVLVNTQTIFAVIPAGSGNGFARHFKIPLDYKRALDLIAAGSVLQVDAGYLDNEPFFCTSGTGIDAETGHYFNQLDNRGLINYARSLIRLFFQYRPKKYEVIIDDTTHQFEAYFVTVANISQFGYNFKIAPAASMTDGLLDVVVMKRFPKLKVFWIALRSVFGHIDRCSSVWHHQARNVIVRSEHDENIVHLDGEPQEHSGELVYSVGSGVLKVIVDEKIKH